MTTNPPLLLTHYVPPYRTSELSDALETSIPPAAIRTAATPAETREHIGDAEAIVTRQLPMDLLESADDLRWMHALSAGVNEYPIAALEDREIVLTNSSGVNAEPIAEHVLCLLLMFERGIHTTVRQQRRSVWERVEGGELRGKTVGIIGVGTIGTRIAQLCSALGTTVLGTKRDVSSGVPDAVDEIYAASEYHDVLGRSDYVILACPLTDATCGLLGADEFRLLSRDAVVINVARGEVVVEDELVRALQKGYVRGAGLDVFEEEPLPPGSPLWDLSNVIVTPHMGHSTPHKIERWQKMITDNYTAFREDRLEEMSNRIV